MTHLSDRIIQELIEVSVLHNFIGTKRLADKLGVNQHEILYEIERINSTGIIKINYQQGYGHNAHEVSIRSGIEKAKVVMATGGISKHYPKDSSFTAFQKKSEPWTKWIAILLTVIGLVIAYLNYRKK